MDLDELVSECGMDDNNAKRQIQICVKNEESDLYGNDGLSSLKDASQKNSARLMTFEIPAKLPPFNFKAKNRL